MLSFVAGLFEAAFGLPVGVFLRRFFFSFPFDDASSGLNLGGSSCSLGTALLFAAVFVFVGSLRPAVSLFTCGATGSCFGVGAGIAGATGTPFGVGAGIAGAIGGVALAAVAVGGAGFEGTAVGAGFTACTGAAMHRAASGLELWGASFGGGDLDSIRRLAVP